MKLGDEVLPSRPKMETLELTKDTAALLRERAQAWAVTPEDAIVRLLHSGVAVEAARTGTPLHPDGRPFCRCSGKPVEYGPWHTGCDRWRAKEQEAGDFS